jgi:hypothetical protein
MIVPDKHFKPSAIFASKGGAYQSGAPERSITDKHYTRVAGNKRSSLLGTVVNYERKKFYNIGH